MWVPVLWQEEDVVGQPESPGTLDTEGEFSHPNQTAWVWGGEVAILSAAVRKRQRNRQ